MRGECGAPFFVALGVAGTFIGGERDLRVHDDRFAARQVDDEIRTLRCAVLGAQHGLDLVFASVLQAGSLQQPLDDQLAPIALALGVALDGACQMVGLVADFIAQRLKLPHLFQQAGGLLGTVLVHLVDPFPETVELFPQRL